MNIFIIVLFRRYVYVKTRHRLLLTERTNTSTYSIIFIIWLFAQTCNRKAV